MARRGASYAGRLAFLLGVLCWLYLSPAQVVQAQFVGAWGAERVAPEQETHLLATWEGREAADGFYLDLPAGWTLRQVRLLRHGYDPMTVRVRRMAGHFNRYDLQTPPLERGLADLVLQVRTGLREGTDTWTLTPYERRSGVAEVRSALQVDHAVRAEAMPADAENRALRLTSEPLLLRTDAVPSLDRGQAFTVELWMKTTGLDQVVASTWTGQEADAYPLELVVDRTGRLRYYHGREGAHTSMTTQGLVADGQWHHVAVTHDAATGWTRLYLDGQPADSLFRAVPRALSARGGIALGGRLADTPEALRYTGLLDEVRMWPTARSLEAVRRTLRQPLSAPGEGVLRLGFETPTPPEWLQRRVRGLERVASDLSFRRAVRGVRAEMEERDVVVSWEAEVPSGTVFTVERSADGRTFVPLGDVDRPQRPPAASEDATYVFRDRDVRGQVVYYRVVRRSDAGEAYASSMLKVGLGQGDEVPAAALLGNFPNPFNAATTITYELREPQHVRVSVWDISGQRIATLVDQVLSAGYHDVPFVSGDLPSGTYLVRMETDGQVQSHKMILAK